MKTVNDKILSEVYICADFIRFLGFQAVAKSPNTLKYRGDYLFLYKNPNPVPAPQPVTQKEKNPYNNYYEWFGSKIYMKNKKSISSCINKPVEELNDFRFSEYFTKSRFNNWCKYKTTVYVFA